MSLPFGLDGLAEHVSKLRLRGGLAGKICHVLIFVSIAMAVIAWSVQVVWVAAGSLVLVFLLVFVMLWRLISLAEKHPPSALMEGAELLVHQQLMIATKGGAQIPTTAAEITSPAPMQISASEMKALEVPESDSAPAKGQEGGGR